MVVERQHSGNMTHARGMAWHGTGRWFTHTAGGGGMNKQADIDIDAWRSV